MVTYAYMSGLQPILKRWIYTVINFLHIASSALGFDLVVNLFITKAAESTIIKKDCLFIFKSLKTVFKMTKLYLCM